MAAKVGVLGSGIVAQVLAAGFSKKGYEVRMGSRDPGKLAVFAREHRLAAGTVAEAAVSGEILVLAVKGSAAIEALALAGDEALADKIVIDTTNPIEDRPPERGVLRFFTGPNDSLMERLQAAHPRARFVKAWNSVGNAFMVDPELPGGPPTMFFCGDDARAKERVAGILRQFGWEPEDVGSAASARALEPLCQLWCLPGFLHDSWSHAFKLLRAV
jgi:predicted dinucleotide-binding enzyme